MSEKNKKKSLTRRKFLKDVAIGGATLIFGDFALVSFGFSKDKKSFHMIVVNYNRCAGCRTCETVCSAFNHQLNIDGKKVLGIGNPFLSNIRVYSYNPDFFVPNVCQFCDDTPCVNACPAPKDSKGRKALYKDEKLGNIVNDPKRCLRCGNCARACKKFGAGVIIPNPETNRPERMCTLCGGDPQCVKECPYGALQFITGKMRPKYYKMSPDRIAEDYIKELYKGGVENERVL